MHYCFPTVGSWEGASSFVRLREFGSEMCKRGIDVTYVVDDIPFNRDPKNLRLHEKARVAFTPNPRSLKQISSRRQTLRDVNADFVHVLNPLPKAWLALVGSSAARGKLVADWDMWQARGKRPPIQTILARSADRWARKSAVLHVVASKYLQAEFKRQFDIDAAYVPFATYLESRRPDGESPYTQPTAVYLGNLYDSTYDHDLVFHAMKLLKDRGKQPPLYVIGSGPDLEKWRQWVRDGNFANVTLTGFLAGDDLWRHVRHGTVLLFPIRPTLQNLCRGPSKTFAYAQARRPIIANRVGEVEELLRENATYVETTPEAFADAIDRALSEPRGDVEYDLTGQTWSARTDDLLNALRQRRLL
ncbi:MAG: glycosyltransferase family 4 protein [Anaerolineae bacterium]|nr:glycosyltransferase family 4 protein [Phycisphaerae bacterium]